MVEYFDPHLLSCNGAMVEVFLQSETLRANKCYLSARAHFRSPASVAHPAGPSGGPLEAAPRAGAVGRQKLRYTRYTLNTPRKTLQICILPDRFTYPF